MAKVQKITGFRLCEINSMSGIYHQETTFRVRQLHATRTYQGKARHGMKLLKAYKKSPLLTISQKGSENTMATM